MVKVDVTEVKPEHVGGELGRRRSRRLGSTRGLRPPTGHTNNGWVRVFNGLQQQQETRGTLVYLTRDTTVRDICRDLVLTEHVSIWMQHGGGSSQRLSPEDRPLALQNAFLERLGYTTTVRRARLGIDPELRHLLRFHTGPATPQPGLEGFSRCGAVLVLKGLVFPQWRRRSIAVLHSRLFLYPGAASSDPEVFDLSGGEVGVRPPKAGRLVLRVAPLDNEKVRHIFLGFNESWERDLWMDWLKQATQLESCSPRLDLSGEGLERLPESLPNFSHVQELHLGRNRLGDGNLKMLSRLPRLRSLHLPGNALRDFPTDLLQLFALSHLDLSNNSLTELPEEICSLVSLEELRVDRNALFRLPRALTRLQKLRNLLVGHNRLHELPGFLLAMKALTSLDFQGNQVENSKMPGKNETNSSPLGRVNLRANLLKGNIVLGNYGNLTQLDMSENRIETLDLSALNMLECVQCSRNQLTELSLSGKALVSLIAGNNRLQKLHINPPPTQLKHLDVSYNELESLPDWIASCYQLRALFASHNKLQVLPEHLFCSELSSLQTLQLSYNRLQTLPTVIRHIPLQELFLQSNSLATLPANFFIVSTRLRVLNLSNNRLCELPNGCHQGHQLEKLYLTANCLADNSLDILGRLANLHTLHAAYNSITTLPESCVAVWTELEELVISGNKLQHLPDNIIHLKHLRVLRIHSNCLQTIPCFAKMTSLKVLDLAHNCLDRVNLATLVPQQLQFLDLSCNSKLYVDPRQFQVYRSHRPMSLVDVSGQNRTCLPSTPYTGGGEDLGPPWKVGFSETAGQRERLYITQIRLPSFCNMEGLFGMFDGGNNNDIPNILTKAVPRMLLEERTVKETASEYMKYTMLSAHRELKETGQKYGVCGTLCHIVRTKPSGSSNFLPGSQHQYTMRVASVGEARAVLRRRSGLINLSQTTQTNPNHNQLGCSAMFPLVIPDPHVTEVDLEETDEFLIIANKRFWEVVSMEEAAQEIQDISNAILAAKRLQDLAQSYGSEENLSIMVVHFGNLTCTDVDRMLRELRHTVQKTKQQCCGNCCFGDGLHKQRYYIQNPPDADRSSPSGQSDHASSDCMGRNRVSIVTSSSSSLPNTAAADHSCHTILGVGLR